MTRRSSILFLAGRTQGGGGSGGGSGGGRGGGRGRYAPPVQESRPPMNEEITVAQIRVIASNAETGKDEALGVMSLEQAMKKAQELGGLDLIMVNDKGDPPVCKIVDYSKYRYSLEKKAKEIKKKSKGTEVKEIKMSYKIDVHDYDVRRKSCQKFLSQGNRVKCTVMFRGREVQHDALGFELLEKLAGDLENLSLKEGRPKREGKNLSVIFTPRPEVVKAINDARRSIEKAKKKKKQEELEKRREARKLAAASGGGVDLEDDEEDLDSDDDDSDEDDDSDDDDDISLDELLGSDEFTDKLFK